MNAAKGNRKSFREETEEVREQPPKHIIEQDADGAHNECDLCGYH